MEEFVSARYSGPGKLKKGYDTQKSLSSKRSGKIFHIRIHI